MTFHCACGCECGSCTGCSCECHAMDSLSNKELADIMVKNGLVKSPNVYNKTRNQLMGIIVKKTETPMLIIKQCVKQIELKATQANTRLLYMVANYKRPKSSRSNSASKPKGNSKANSKKAKKNERPKSTSSRSNSASKPKGNSKANSKNNSKKTAKDRRCKP